MLAGVTGILNVVFLLVCVCSALLQESGEDWTTGCWSAREILTQIIFGHRFADIRYVDKVLSRHVSNFSGCGAPLWE